MIANTSCKSLRELNAALKKDGAGYEVIYIGFMPSSGVGIQTQTRHYLRQLTEGENAGATVGDFFEIVFNAPYDEDDFLSEPNETPAEYDGNGWTEADQKEWQRQLDKMIESTDEL